MSDSPKKIPIPKSLTEGHYETQTEMLQVQPRHQSMYIGIPKEVILQETRVALVPSSVRALLAHGHRVIVEKDAGLKANYADIHYSETGAEIAYSKEEVYKADVILKAAPPTVEEIELMRPNQILISPLQMPIITSEYLQRLKHKRVISLAMEYILGDDGTYPVVRTMSELAGLNAVLTAAELMSTTSGGKGILLGGISGVPPARIVIIGAGVVAEFATRAALGLGAEVRIFDNNIYKLKRIQDLVGTRLYTSSINSVYLEKELMRADVAIGAIHSKTGRTPIVVSEDLVSRMKPGSVIVDISIDQGGCFATSRLTSLDHPTFVQHEVIHYCVPNIASRYARSASIAISNIMTPILLQAGHFGSIEKMLFTNPGLRHGVYTYKGCLTNEFLGQRFNIKSTDLDLLITSSL